MESPTGSKDSTLLIPTMGASIIGSWGTVLLYGITTLQSYQYFTKYWNRDGAWMKVFVGLLWIFETAHTSLICETLFRQLIENFYNPVLMLETRPADDTTTVFTALIILFVHLFYCWRIWVLSSRKIWLCGPILLLALAHFGMELGTVYFTIKFSAFSEFHRVTPWFTGGMALAAADDLIIATSMFYLLNTRRTGVKSTDNLVTKLVTYVLTTGLLTTIIDLIVIITFVTMNTKNLVYLTLFDILPNLYTNACLAMLNARPVKTESKDLQSENANTISLGFRGTGDRSQSAGSHTMIIHKDIDVSNHTDPTDSNNDYFTKV